MMKRFLALASLSALALVSAHAADEPQMNQGSTAAESAAAAQRRLCEAAIPQYRTAVAADPSDAVSHNLLGICHQRLGQTKAAKREYDLAIKLNPQYGRAYNNLATVFHAQGKYKKAVKYYRAAIERDANIAAAHRNLGTALLAMGKFPEGLAAYAEAQRLDPTILDTTGAVSVGVGDATVAQQYFYFAKISARAGQVEAALDFLRKARAVGFDDFGKVRKDPDFKDIVPDQRFAALTR